MEERIIGKEPRRDVIQWHPAFCSAAELEFLENRNNLEFQREVNLSKKPLEMDLLIVKKQPGVVLVNEIGHMFRGHNIIEYKSPNDSMTIDDFFKTLAYACLYKATKGRRVDEIKVREITVSMFRESYPKQMFGTLEALGMQIEPYQDGIYYIKGNIPFHMQVIVTEQLDKQKHQSLRVLSKKLAEEDARNFLKKIEILTGERDKELIDSVLNVSISANRKLYEKMKGVNIMCNTLKEFFKEDWDNIKKQVEEEAREKVYKEAQEKVYKEAQEKVKKETFEEKIVLLQKLMGKMQLSAEQALDFMEIPEADRAQFLSRL